MTMPPLDELRFVEVADVFKAGRLAARLVRTTDGVEFTYVEDYPDGGGPPVAISLPFDAKPRVRPGGALPAFFTGLLPEGRRLSGLRRAVKTSADDDLSLLLAVGSDTVGDVQVVPEGANPTAFEPRIEVERWDTVRFAELYSRETGGSLPDRVGIPGVQEKVSARMISLPVAERGSRFILKLNPPELPHLVENEAFFLRAARLSGLPVADADLVEDIDGRKGLLVRRFDRSVDEHGLVHSLAQEDACQVLDLYPSEKYRLPFEQVASALTGVTQARPVAGRDLLRQVTFAYLTGNGDAHAKNFSVLRSRDGERRISPAYDLPSSHPYGDTTMALSIGGAVDERIGRSSFLGLAADIGVRGPAAARVLDELADASDVWVHDLDELPFDPRRIHKLRRSVEYRRDRLRAS